MTNGDKAKRLSKIAREFNVGIHTIVEFLQKKGVTIESNPNTKIAPDAYHILLKEYSTDIRLKEESAKLEIGKHRGKQESISIESELNTDTKPVNEVAEQEVIIKDNSSSRPVVKEEPVAKEVEKESKENVKVKVVGKIDLKPKKKEKKKEDEASDTKTKEDSKSQKVEELKSEKKIETTEDSKKPKVKESIKVDDKKSEQKKVEKAPVKEKIPEIKTKIDKLDEFQSGKASKAKSSKQAAAHESQPAQ